jgi:hypothetical protein
MLHDTRQPPADQDGAALGDAASDVEGERLERRLWV